MKTICLNKLYAVAFLLLLFPLGIMAQATYVTGNVTDVTGEPIPGATIRVTGQPTIGTVTDIDGNFSLAVQGEPTLEISFIGYKTQQVKATPASPMKIVLEETAQNLSEVVVVGYGTQKKVNLTGAVEQVGEEVFNNRSVSSVSQALQGAVPNLNISMEDGKPGREATYNVRGTTSIGQGGSALVLIDGVEGDPTMLNPNDIASVSVLKDAASAAIYGARGSFGVVLITTKGADKGKVSVNYTGNFSMQSPTNTPDFVTDGVVWAEHFREAFYNYNKTIPAKINAQQAYSDEWLAEFKRRKEAGITDEVEVAPDGSYVYYGNTDWYDLLFKDQTFAQDHNVTISGGSEKADFYLSGRFYKYNGLYNYNPDTYQSINLRAKGSLQLFDWLRISNNMEFTNTDHHNPTVASYSYTVQRYIEVAGFPTMPVFNPDGSHTICSAYTIGGFMDGTNYQSRNNKLLKNTTAFSAKFLDNRLHVNGDFTFRYKAYDNMRKRTRVTYSEKENVFTTLGSYDDIQRGFATTLYTATNLYADFEQTFGGKHYFKAMGGYNYETSAYKAMSANRNGVLLEDATSIALALGDAITLDENINNWRILGLFFRLNYGYKDRYLFEVNGRYDGSSKFPSNQQYAFFPSYSAGWRLSEEPFWKEWTNNFFDNLKIRASYGSLGNGNVSPYSFMELLSISTSGRVLGGARPNYTSAPAVIPNSLTWETATTTDIGLDMSMLDGRLQLSGDYYIRKTSDMYTVGVTLPEVFGATSPKGNYADMTTRGWELSVSYRDRFNLAGKPFNWEIRGTLHDYKSKIDKYNNATKSLDDYYEGQTIGEIWGYRTEGLFQSDAETEGYVNTIVQSSVDKVWLAGDVKFADLNNNGRIDYGDNTATNPGDKVIIGNSEPRYIYSFTLSADWNDIFFSAFFQGVGKQDWFPSKESPFWGQYNRPYNSLPSWQIGNYWTPDNPDAYLPRYSTYNSALGWGGTMTDRYLQNVAYLRLKNLQIGYNLPKTLVAKAGMQAIRVYLTGENLLCWSPLYKRTKDFDVSTATTGTDSDLGGNSMGEGNSYPLMRSVSLGLSITF